MKQFLSALTVMIVGTCLLLLIPTASEAGGDMEAAVNTYVEAWNTGQLDALDKVMDADFTRHVCGVTQVTTLAGLKEVIIGFRADFPDVKVTITDLFFSGDKCGCRWSFTGTEKVSGKTVFMTGLTISHWKDGKAVEEWVEYDNEVMKKQLEPQPSLPDAPENMTADPIE